MDSCERGRRSLLERTSQLLAAGGLAGLAGCLGGEDGLDPMGRSGPATGTRAGDGGSFAPADWLPAPTAVSAGGHYGFGVLRPAALAPASDTLGTSYYGDLVATRGALSATGIDPRRVDTHVALAAASVLDAQFDADAVTGSLSDAGFERSGTHRRFELWRPTEGATVDPGTVGVGRDVVVVGRETRATDPEAAIGAVVDAGLGRSDRLLAVSDPAARLVERLAGADIAQGVTHEPYGETVVDRGQFAGNAALGHAVSVDGDTATVRLSLVFESASRADTDAVREWVEDAGSGSALDRMRDVTVEGDGAVVVVSGRMDTAALSETALGGIFVASGSEPEDALQADVTVSADQQAHRVTVTWTSGETPDSLRVRFTPTQGDHVDERIDAVGESASYANADSETIWITVFAHADGRQARVLDRRFDF